MSSSTLRHPPLTPPGRPRPRESTTYTWSTDTSPGVHASRGDRTPREGSEPLGSRGPTSRRAPVADGLALPGGIVTSQTARTVALERPAPQRRHQSARGSAGRLLGLAVLRADRPARVRPGPGLPRVAGALHRLGPAVPGARRGATRRRRGSAGDARHGRRPGGGRRRGRRGGGCAQRVAAAPAGGRRAARDGGRPGRRPSADESSGRKQPGGRRGHPACSWSSPPAPPAPTPGQQPVRRAAAP